MDKTEKPKGVLFIDASQLKAQYQITYYSILVVGISCSFILMQKYVLPAIVYSTLSMNVFYLALIGVAVLWVGIIKLLNVYWLQSKLVEKGSLC